MQIGLPFAQHHWRTHMFKWLLEKYQEWQFERAFQKRKKHGNLKLKMFGILHLQPQENLFGK